MKICRMQIFYQNKYACLRLCSRLCTYLGMHVEWSILAFASVCACGQIVEDCVTMVILNQKPSEREREKLGSWSVSCLAPNGDSHTLTLLKDFYSLSIHMCSSLCFPFQSCIYSFSVNCQITFIVIFTNTSNKAQDVNVVLLPISAAATELVIIIKLIGQMLM